MLLRGKYLHYDNTSILYNTLTFANMNHEKEYKSITKTTWAKPLFVLNPT